MVSNLDSYACMLPYVFFPLKLCLLSSILAFANFLSLSQDMYCIQQLHGLTIVEVRTIRSSKILFPTKYMGFHTHIYIYREMIFVQPFCDNFLTILYLILTLCSYSLSSFFPSLLFLTREKNCHKNSHKGLYKYQYD